MACIMEKAELNARLFHAVACGNLFLTKALIGNGADVLARDYCGSTCLHLAASRNHYDLVVQLIEMGADVVSKDSLGNMPLDAADRMGHTMVVNALQRPAAGASVSSPRAAVDRGCSNAERAIKAHFPDDIATMMMSNLRISPQTKRSVSIFFSNIENYHHHRATLQPTVVLSMLDRLHRKLDELAALHGVQRIDAIDGCYIAASNFSRRQPADHAACLARFAVASMAAASAITVDPERPELGTVRLLAGVHCGAVCGTMIGAHGGCKYTLVGDAVNVASRMQSHGAAGAIQCSAAFAAAVEKQAGAEDGLRLVERAGGVELKGRGRMGAFWLESARALSRGAAGDEMLPAGPAWGSPLTGSAPCHCAAAPMDCGAVAIAGGD